MNKFKNFSTLLALMLGIFAVSIIFVRPVLETWGVIAWFRPTPPGLGMWEVWLKTIFNEGTQSRPFQVIGWVIGIQFGRVLPFDFATNSIFGIAIFHGLITVFKFVLIYKSLPKNTENNIKYLVCLIGIYPAVWPGILNPQSLSLTVSSLFFLSFLYFFIKFLKSNNKKHLYLIFISFFLMMNIYQGLILSIVFVFILALILNRFSKPLHKLKIYKLMGATTASFLTYGAYLYVQFIRLGDLGYETSGAAGRNLKSLVISFFPGVINIYQTLFRESPIINIVWFATMYILFKQISKNFFTPKLVLIFLTITPLTSLIFFLNQEWLNDPNRVLFPTSFSLLSFLLLLLNHQDMHVDESFESKNKFGRTQTSKYKPPKLSVCITVFVLSQIVIGVYSHGNLVRQNFDNQKEIVKLVKTQINFMTEKKVLIRDFTQEIGDYYFFFGQGSVLNVALQAEGITSNIMFCTPLFPGENFRVEHRQALIRKIGNGPQTHPGSCLEGRFLKGNYAEIYELTKVEGEYVLKVN